MPKGFFGDLFDFNHDGTLDPLERAMDLMAFEEMMNEDSTDTDEAAENLADLGIDVNDYSGTDFGGLYDD